MADATNSSLTEVKILVKSSGQCNNEPDACTAITVEIRPRDRNHETYVISKMKLTKDCLTPPYPPCKSFLVNELNLRLQNLTTENDLSFLSQYDHYRVPYGNSLFYNINIRNLMQILVIVILAAKFLFFYD